METSLTPFENLKQGVAEGHARPGDLGGILRRTPNQPGRGRISLNRPRLGRNLKIAIKENARAMQSIKSCIERIPTL